MTGPTDPSMKDAAEHMAAEAGPIIGHQRARLGAARFAAFCEGHARLQAAIMFLLMSGMTVPQADYSDEALDALRQDARDLRMAAGAWARTCEELADHWQAQREENRGG